MLHFPIPRDCKGFAKFIWLARLRRPPAAFLLNGAITRPATGSITFRQPYRSYMQSFVKIGVLVLEKNADETMTLCNFNKDVAKQVFIWITICRFTKLKNNSSVPYVPWHFDTKIPSWDIFVNILVNVPTDANAVIPLLFPCIVWKTTWRNNTQKHFQTCLLFQNLL